MPTSLSRSPRPLAALVVAVPFALSFLLPAINDSDKQLNSPLTLPGLLTVPGLPEISLGYWSPVIPGWAVFLDVVAWFPLSAWFVPCWFANPAMIIGLWHLASGRLGAARICAAVSTVLASTSLVVFIGFPWMTPLIGYYVWMAAMALFPVAAWTSGGWLTRRGKDDAQRSGKALIGFQDERVRQGREVNVQR